MWINNDAYFHQGDPPENRQLTFRKQNVPTFLSSITKVHMYGVFRATAQVATQTRCLFQCGTPLSSQGFGLYFALNDATKLRLVVNTSVAATTQQVITDFAHTSTTEAIVVVEIDFMAKTATLWVNGTLVSTVAQTALSGSGIPDGVICMGHDGGTRFAPAEVKHFGFHTGTGFDRIRTEGWLAQRYGQRALLPGDHAYKSVDV